MANRYRRRETPAELAPFQQRELPIGQQAALYYRQSQMSQVGNLSTAMQQVDLGQQLVRYGWRPEQIIHIDSDAGVSGALGIAQRPGMKRLMDLIAGGDVGLVAAQDVDRFFRDAVQIDTNIFIQACASQQVLVLTPDYLFDFNHPTRGMADKKLFREKSEAAAAFLEHHVKGRMLKAKQKRADAGEWNGRSIALGFMVDLREKLPDGRANPDRHRYRACPMVAPIVRAWFEGFRAHDGNLLGLYRELQASGPYLPEFDTPGLVPPGHKVTNHFKRRDPDCGQLLPSYNGLGTLLTNVVYIGHWVQNDAITHWHNHEAIIPEDLFMFAFNRLSATDFFGDPNPHHIPYRPYIRHAKAARTATPPTYAGLLVSDDIPDQPDKRLQCGHENATREYHYKLVGSQATGALMCMKSMRLDAIIDELLRARLAATRLDPALWDAARAALETGAADPGALLRDQLASEARRKANLKLSLNTLGHPDLIREAEAQYAGACARIAQLEAELAGVQDRQTAVADLTDAQAALGELLDRWAETEPRERRDLLEVLSERRVLSREGRMHKRITIAWCDGTSTTQVIGNYGRGQCWSAADSATVKAMIEAHADQVEILRALPGYRWRNILDYYSRTFNQGKRPDWRGEKLYNQDTRWEDIAGSQARSSCSPSSTGANGPQVRPLPPEHLVRALR